MKKLLMELALVAASILASILLVMAGLYIAGYPAHRVLLEWAEGSVQSKFDLAVGLKNACPLILTGLCAGIAFRCGVFNIGGEGQALLGALGAVVAANECMPHAGAMIAIPFALLLAMLAGGAWALLAALLDRYRGVPVVLSTILLNFVALKLMQMLLEGPHGPLRDRTTGVPQSAPIPQAYDLPALTRALPGLHAGILIALAAAVVIWVLQARTVFGFELRVTGLNATAAKLAGIPVARRQLWVMALSGACAGLAGAIQLMGITHVQSIESPGIGYMGIAVALLGRLHPLGIVLAALFFGMLDQGATNVEISQYALPHDVADIVKGIIVLAVLAGTAFLTYRRTAAGDGE